jgi:hypothetical protein
LDLLAASAGSYGSQSAERTARNSRTSKLGNGRGAQNGTVGARQSTHTSCNLSSRDQQRTINFASCA